MTKKLLLSFLMFMPLLASAGDDDPPSFYYTEVDGLYYSFDKGNNTATLTCKAKITEKIAIDTYRTNIVSADYSGSVVIPSEVTYNNVTYSVTSINSYAFYNCSGLTSITIPSSVTNISSNAFENCSDLTSIVVENGNPKYDSRDNCNAIIESESNTLFQGFKNTIIPNGVTSIGSGAFKNCSGLTSINIPGGVTSIKYSAFENCRDLTSINILDGVENIGISAFSGCSGLTSITIPQSVISIGSYAFLNCI